MVSLAAHFASVAPAVEVLAFVRDDRTGADVPVAVRQGSVMATSFHPELTSDTRFHGYFIDLVKAAGSSASPK